METWIMTTGLIAVMIVVLGILAIIQSRKQAEIMRQNPGYPKGYWMNRGMGIGIAIGAGVGVALGNIAIGVAIGVAIGAGIGSRMEQQHKDEIRPMTDEEIRLRNQSMWIGIAVLLAGVVVFAVTYFLAR